MVSDCPCGFTFYLRGHLHVVIAEIAESPTRVVVINLTTKRTGSDETVILKEDDHPFIKHDTAINYQDTRMFDKAQLIERLNHNFFKIGEIFSEDKVKLMQRGLIESPFTPRDIKAICTPILGPRDSEVES